MSLTKEVTSAPSERYLSIGGSEAMQFNAELQAARTNANYGAAVGSSVAGNLAAGGGAAGEMSQLSGGQAAQPQHKPFIRNKKVPLSIQTNNPGAMWPGPSAKKFGSTETYQINDRQRNKIAVFDNPVSGAAAQFDLLARKYAGKPLDKAIRTWSGNNSSSQYTKSVAKAMGMGTKEILTLDHLKGEAGIVFAKAMAKQEAGRTYPMTDNQWRQAQALAFGTQTAPATVSADE